MIVGRGWILDASSEVCRLMEGFVTAPASDVFARYPTREGKGVAPLGGGVYGQIHLGGETGFSPTD